MKLLSVLWKNALNEYKIPAHYGNSSSSLISSKTTSAIYGVNHLGNIFSYIARIISAYLKGRSA
jgi:hypothetical protein